MSPTRTRVLALAGIGLLAFLSQATVARSVVVPGAPAAAAENAAVYRLQSGRISNIDVRRGVLVVDGQSYRLDARKAAFSDDRADPPSSGLASLRIGDKVVVRSIRSNGVPLVVQIVVGD